MRVLADTVCTVVVLAAFGAGFRYPAGRAFGRAPGPPRLRLPGRRGAVTLSLSRAVARVVVLAARFASARSAWDSLHSSPVSYWRQRSGGDV
jgi:hypothetical protein